MTEYRDQLLDAYKKYTLDLDWRGAADLDAFLKAVGPLVDTLVAERNTWKEAAENLARECDRKQGVIDRQTERLRRVAAELSKRLLDRA